MNNILTLYDMEFKRIYKIYFTLIGILLASNIGATLFSIYSVPSRTSDIEGNPITVNVLKSEEGIRYIYEYLIGDLTSITKMAVAFSVLLCLLYSLVIWYRDYFSKSKTIATLLMLPQKRFNIYIAKLITVTSMIFGVISVQFLFWFIDLVIIKAILNVNVEIILGFAQNAKYTLLDEPFSGIDIFKREEFLGVMTKYINEEQSIILTTHEISEIEMIADDVILIDEGRIDIFKREEFLGVMTKYINEEQSIILTTHEISEIEMIADDVILIDEGKVSCIFNAEELRTRDGMSIVDKMREVYKGE